MSQSMDRSSSLNVTAEDMAKVRELQTKVREVYPCGWRNDDYMPYRYAGMKLEARILSVGQGTHMTIGLFHPEGNACRKMLLVHYGGSVQDVTVAIPFDDQRMEEPDFTGINNLNLACDIMNSFIAWAKK